MYDGQSGYVRGEGCVLPLHVITGGFSDIQMRHQIASQTAVLALGISPLISERCTLETKNVTALLN